MYSSKLNYIVALVVFTVGCLPSLSSSSCIVKYRNYSVVVESKQLETKAWVYSFLNTNGRKFRIGNPGVDSDVFGLNFYGSSAHEYLRLLSQVIDRIKDQVPDMIPSETPLTFVATGVGNMTNVTGFLNEVWIFLNKTGFLVRNDSVMQLHGKRKFYSWMSVNLLLGRFQKTKKHKKPQPTATVLELGTGSAHEGFERTLNQTLSERQMQKVTNLTICGQIYSVFGTSVSGLGLYDARANIFMQSASSNVPKKRVKRIRRGSRKYIVVNVTTPCFHPNVTTYWVYKDTVYYLTGEESGTTGINMTKCRQLAENVIYNHTTSPSLFGMEIYGMTYYYKTLKDANSVTFGDDKKISVKEIEEKAQEICNMPYPETPLTTPVIGNGPYICMDLIYIHELLTQFYQLENKSRIDVVLQLSGVNVEWPLGLAYEKYNEQKKSENNVMRSSRLRRAG